MVSDYGDQKLVQRGITRKQMGLCALAAVLASLFAVPYGAAQANSSVDQKPQMAEQVFKNVQVLRGISVDEFINTMGFFAASLGMNCVDCHTAASAGHWDKFAEDTPLKNRARMMVVMMRSINQGNFGGKQMVTCYSCHRGIDTPEITPSLAQQYSTPPPEDPDKVDIHGQASKGPSADEILNRYLEALGGAQKVASLNSFTAKGTYAGYDTDTVEVPVDIYAKAPNQLTTVVHTALGDSTSTFDGNVGWVAAIDKPVPLLLLTGGDLEGARVDAEVILPARIKEEFSNWRSGFPEVVIDNRTLQVIEGTTQGGARVKFYFDRETGLLARQVRYVDTVVGSVPIHIEYSDYQAVAGVKLPFHWTATWTDGQSTTKLSEIQPNVEIDASKFDRPGPAVLKPAKE
jgi:photosynthetic reaction center cytochrome c subunit